MRQCMDAENLHRRMKKLMGQLQAIDQMIDKAAWVSCEANKAEKSQGTPAQWWQVRSTVAVSRNQPRAAPRVWTVFSTSFAPAESGKACHHSSKAANTNISRTYRRLIGLPSRAATHSLAFQTPFQDFPFAYDSNTEIHESRGLRAGGSDSKLHGSLH